MFLSRSIPYGGLSRTGNMGISGMEQEEVKENRCSIWLQFLWDIAWIPVRYFYCKIRYGLGSYGNILSWYKLTWDDFFEDKRG